MRRPYYVNGVALDHPADLADCLVEAAKLVSTTGIPFNARSLVDRKGFDARDVIPAPGISIDRVKDSRVRGHVTNVSPADCRVVLYARTDAFYLQPFEDSILEIDDDGGWETGQVKHGDEYYAWLIRHDFKPQSVMKNPLVVDGRRVLAEAVY